MNTSSSEVPLPPQVKKPRASYRQPGENRDYIILCDITHGSSKRTRVTVFMVQQLARHLGMPCAKNVRIVTRKGKVGEARHNGRMGQKRYFEFCWDPTSDTTNPHKLVVI